MDNLKNPDARRASFRLLIRDANIWAGTRVVRASILLEGGRIKKIARRISGGADELIHARGLLALPGLVDAHAHLRDMKLSYKEDFTSGTSAAAAGGFTTVLDMPNTMPPTDSGNRVLQKAERASKKIIVNVGFHTAAVEDLDAARAMRTAGSFSMKLYLPNPVSPMNATDDDALIGVMDAARESCLPLTVHAEDPAQFGQARTARTFKQLAVLRKGRSESTAVNRILRLQKRNKCKIHFCHISLPTSISAIENSNDNDLSSEVTPHHTLLSEESLATLGWKAWMVPPLRTSNVRKHLFREMATGHATIVATDHAPHTIEEKQQSPPDSLPGIPGLETTLPLMLTLVNKGKISLGQLVTLLSTNPAKIFGLHSKGKLEKGADGDVTLVDIKKKGKIDPDKFLSKAHYSPFEGWETVGAVHTTIVNGNIVYRDEEIIGEPGSGTVMKSTTET